MEGGERQIGYSTWSKDSALSCTLTAEGQSGWQGPRLSMSAPPRAAARRLRRCSGAGRSRLGPAG